MKLSRKQKECLKAAASGTIHAAFQYGNKRFKGDFHRKTINALVNKGLLAERPAPGVPAFCITAQGEAEYYALGLDTKAFR